MSYFYRSVESEKVKLWMGDVILSRHLMYGRDIILMSPLLFAIFMKGLIWKAESKLFHLVFTPLTI